MFRKALITVWFTDKTKIGYAVKYRSEEDLSEHQSRIWRGACIGDKMPSTMTLVRIEA